MRIPPQMQERPMKSMLRTVLAGALAGMFLLSLAAGAAAETTKIARAKVSVWFPDDWSMEKRGTMLVISDPADEVGLAFLTVPARKLDEVLDELDKQIGGFATDIALDGQPQETEINGMKAVVVDGKGKAQGKRVGLSIAVVERPGGQALILFGAIEQSKLKKHEKTLVKVLQSLRPIK
jgi:hypothetical protein